MIHSTISSPLGDLTTAAEDGHLAALQSLRRLFPHDSSLQANSALYLSLLTEKDDRFVQVSNPG
jgi:hypothetical protein